MRIGDQIPVKCKIITILIILSAVGLYVIVDALYLCR